MKLRITVTKAEASEYVRQAITKVTPGLGNDITVEISDGPFGPVVPEDRVKALVEAVVGGVDKIGFIKEYRGLTGVGLKEAKDASEALVPKFAPRAY